MATNGRNGKNGRSNGHAQRPELVMDDQERGLFRVHRSVFTDPDILAMERERIFDRCWIYAGHASEVRKPGDFVTRRVAGRPVIITRGRDDKIRVLLNTCTHRGAVVCRELRGNAKVHQCFYHGWSYTPEGEINGIPGEDAYSEAFDRNERRLAEPPGGTSIYRDFIFVNFNRANDISLDDYLWDAKDYLDLVADQSAGQMEIVSGTQTYSMKGNYKLLVENSIDGYHAMTTHKRYFDWLVGANAMDKDVMAQLLGADENEEAPRLSPKVLGNGHSIIGRSVQPWGRPMAQWIPYFGEERKPHFEEMYRKAVERLGEERAHEVCMCGGNLHIFPNLIINDIMSTTVRTFYPIEPGYMEITAWCLGPEEEQPEERALRLDNFLTFLGPGGFATPDDVEALEACQRGFETVKEVEYSDVSRGMKRFPHGDDELQMRAFWRQWARLMNAPEPVSIHGTPARVGA
ncbi:MAG: aromatic ring-hydroxylating dioxygenase subunit alpha [Chloroflexota bacterium]|nr:aromatic ring-hydroxylating dioxygenase subunit alpha [Chloroflexota bacterium]